MLVLLIGTLSFLRISNLLLGSHGLKREIPFLETLQHLEYL